MRYGPSKKAGAARTGRSSFKAILKEVSNWGLCFSIFNVIRRNLNEIKCKNLKELIVFYATHFNSVLREHMPLKLGLTHLLKVVVEEWQGQLG